MLTVAFVFFLTLFLLLYKFITQNFDRWEKAGIPFKPGRFPLGSINFLSGKKNGNEYILDLCKEFKDEKFFGYYSLGKPMLVIQDLEMMKAMKTRDFRHFPDTQDENISRTLRTGGELDSLFNHNVGSARGDEWRDVRSSLTPVFTSGKMKAMMKFIVEVSENLLAEMEKKSETGEFELKDVTGKFSLDALASCAFGIDFNSFGGAQSSAFVEHASELFKQDIWGLLAIFKFLPGVPRLFQMLNINVQKPKTTKFFRDIVTDTLKTRAKSGERRNDMIDMMVDAMKQIAMDKEQKEQDETEQEQFEQDMKFNHKQKRKLTEQDIISNLIVLLIVGYDTTGMTLAAILWALSENQDVQEKLRREVDEAWEAANGVFPDYSSLQALPYLEMVVMETLRLYGPAALTMRACNEDYRLPGTDFTVRKNDMIFFPNEAFHKDPNQWSHPNTFNPDQWAPEERSKRSPHAFQAFGQGPRACLGMRFALLELKVAVAMLVRHLELLPGSTTIKPLQLDPSHGMAWFKGGLWASIKRRDLAM